MPSRLERLLRAQGGKCFFCNGELPPEEASVEHLIARANGGRSHDDNCVACCKSLNQRLGSMSVKDKLTIILNRRRDFCAPNGSVRPEAPIVPKDLEGKVRVVIFNLRNRSAGLPRTAKKLANTINALFQKSLSNEQVTAIIGRMQKCRYITVTGTKVSYSLPLAEPGM